GSVSQENAAEIVSQENVDGLFVGRAAWDVEGFIGLIKLVEQASGLLSGVNTVTGSNTPREA
ncbi:MAG: triose-phosphate isomerase, partial [Rudaea sp.]